MLENRAGAAPDRSRPPGGGGQQENKGGVRPAVVARWLREHGLALLPRMGRVGEQNPIAGAGFGQAPALGPAARQRPRSNGTGTEESTSHPRHQHHNPSEMRRLRSFASGLGTRRTRRRRSGTRGTRSTRQKTEQADASPAKVITTWNYQLHFHLLHPAKVLLRKDTKLYRSLITFCKCSWLLQNF